MTECRSRGGRRTGPADNTHGPRSRVGLDQLRPNIMRGVRARFPRGLRPRGDDRDGQDAHRYLAHLVGARDITPGLDPRHTPFTASVVIHLARTLDNRRIGRRRAARIIHRALDLGLLIDTGETYRPRYRDQAGAVAFVYPVYEVPRHAVVAIVRHPHVVPTSTCRPALLQPLCAGEDRKSVRRGHRTRRRRRFYENPVFGTGVPPPVSKRRLAKMTSLDERPWDWRVEYVQGTLFAG